LLTVILRPGSPWRHGAGGPGLRVPWQLCHGCRNACLRACMVWQPCAGGALRRGSVVREWPAVRRCRRCSSSGWAAVPPG